MQRDDAVAGHDPNILRGIADQLLHVDPGQVTASNHLHLGVEGRVLRSPGLRDDIEDPLAPDGERHESRLADVAIDGVAVLMVELSRLTTTCGLVALPSSDLAMTLPACVGVSPATFTMPPKGTGTVPSCSTTCEGSVAVCPPTGKPLELSPCRAAEPPKSGIGVTS